MPNCPAPELEGLVLLDLDHTIICAVELDKLDTVNHPEKFKVYYDFDNMYRIYERPYLQKFLDKLFSTYRVAIWTAAGISYANFIIEHFIKTKPCRKLEFVLWSEHCEVSEERYDHQKKLKMIEFYEKKLVILDDNSEVLTGQKKKSVDSQDFDVTQEDAYKDDFLLTALDEIGVKMAKING